MKNVFLFGALLIPTIVYSANDLERWNSEVGRTVRQTHSDKLAQTTYSEISSKNVNVSQDMRNVYPQIETSAQVAGSKTRVVAEAKLVVDKDKVWRDWNKKLNKWGPRVGAAAVVVEIGGRIMDAVDWVMDPKNNTISKKDNSVNVSDKFQSKYKDKDIYASGEGQLCIEYAKNWKTDNSPDKEYPAMHYKSHVIKGTSQLLCSYYYYPGAYTTTVDIPISRNPNYQQEKPVIPVSDEEKEQVLKNLLNDPKYADLANKMIGNTYTIGSDNPEPDPNIVNDIKDAQKGTLKSDDPKGDGRTRTDPKIDTGTQGQAETTPNPDTGTVTNPDTGTGTTPTPNPSPNNGSTTSFELPAFCNYAAKLCDWLDWTQEDKDLEEAEKEEPEELDLGTIDKNRFSANGQCPAPKEIDETVKALGRNVKFDFQIEWTPICNVAEDTSPLVLLISTITGLLILVGGGRTSES